MAYKKVSLSEAAKKPRRITPRFERTKEWKLMRADLERGLKPGEALQILITDEDRAKQRLPKRRPIARFVQRYLKEHEMTYLVRSFHRDEGDYILVFAPKAARKAQSA